MPLYHSYGLTMCKEDLLIMDLIVDLIVNFPLLIFISLYLIFIIFSWRFRTTSSRLESQYGAWQMPLYHSYGLTMCEEDLLIVDLIVDCFFL